ncbi:unnamed protein product [Clavelina lepadiformis]|uniref:Uncharacterized protein n=1 Tax=Clavelina lepadiformis TaxID=159417 RepID=A0ABP0GYA9_CLALP
MHSCTSIHIAFTPLEKFIKFSVQFLVALKFLMCVLSVHSYLLISLRTIVFKRLRSLYGYDFSVSVTFNDVIYDVVDVFEKSSRSIGNESCISVVPGSRFLKESDAPIFNLVFLDNIADVSCTFVSNLE